MKKRKVDLSRTKPRDMLALKGLIPNEAEVLEGLRKKEERKRKDREKWQRRKEREAVARYDSVGYLKTQLAMVDERLIEAIKQTKSPALIQLYYQRVGIMKKDGGSVGNEDNLTAEQLIGLERKAREDRVAVDREDKVSGGLPVLSPDVRMDTEQEHGEEDKVGELGIPVDDMWYPFDT